VIADVLLGGVGGMVAVSALDPSRSPYGATGWRWRCCAVGGCRICCACAAGEEYEAICRKRA